MWSGAFMWRLVCLKGRKQCATHFQSYTIYISTIATMVLCLHPTYHRPQPKPASCPASHQSHSSSQPRSSNSRSNESLPHQPTQEPTKLIPQTSSILQLPQCSPILTAKSPSPDSLLEPYFLKISSQALTTHTPDQDYLLSSGALDSFTWGIMQPQDTSNILFL